MTTSIAAKLEYFEKAQFKIIISQAQLYLKQKTSTEKFIRVRA